MDWKRNAGLAGGAAFFAGAIAVGAWAVTSMLPAERLPVAQERALLAESASGSTPPGARAESPSASLPSPYDGPAASAGPVSPPVPVPRDPPSRPTERSQRPAAVREPPAAAPQERREPVQTLAAVAPPERQADPVRRALAPPPAAPAAPRADGVLTVSEIRRIKLSLRLTREQEPYWLPLEQLLRDLAVQQEAMVRAGQNPKDAFGTGAAMRMFSAARPLLDVLREDQKAQVRARAQAMGFGAIASAI